MSRVTTAVVLTIALTGLTGCGIHAGETSFSLGREADSTFEWSGQVDEDQWLEIKGINGKLTAMPATGNTVQVTAVRKGLRSDPNEVEIVVVEHADGVTICAVYPSSGSQPNECAPGDSGRNSTRRNDVKVEFDVSVPAGVRFAGRMVNGAIQAEDLTADVRAQTVNGNVRVSTSEGAASGKTVNGSISAAFGETSWDGEAAFETVNGSIRLNVPEQINADLEIRTTNGRITTDLPVNTTRATRRRVEGTLGEGGPDLRLKTVNGSITLGPTE
ncbi:MAG: DUF4097 family beta strand repeat-containing protein [Vicinamibacterales bacterium]|jgi:hypothetical protein|nr:DUF4097 family beta strand repeat-containing protein [Vicinamibacterales bacterium]MDP7691667.1 DUF4097 family beta strand repeat-containing protein [Vicinamibacterales bacterium]HJN45319.1 DUF4097 family beta strand repeat-containing protein [Vicinamibacterales bacterium]